MSIILGEGTVSNKCILSVKAAKYAFPERGSITKSAFRIPSIANRGINEMNSIFMKNLISFKTGK
jgi:hypothetical protein